MTASDNEWNCGRCGCAVPAPAGGLCPRCLLRAGLAGWAGRGEDGAVAPGYRLLEKIGEGGMGEVFLAEQHAPVRREVAFKRLKPGPGHAEWARRFDLEREALAQLDHPHIAKIFDAGLTRDGRPFYALELIDGPPLTDFCTRGRLDVAARLRLFLAVCAAVQHAHQKGVLHGDLKPSNILVAVDEAGAPVPKLIDFGVARAVWRPDGAEPAPASGRFGTPGYASPEQHGGARPPDARSDVFALGVVLRELLGAEETMRRGEAGWMVRRATADVPEERYESAAALASDVRNLLADRPLAAGPGAWTYRARKFLRRERMKLAIALVTACVLGAAAAGLFRQFWRAQRAEAGARMARQLAARDFLRAQLTEDLVHGLASALRDRNPVQREEHIRRLLQRLGARAEETAEQGAVEVAFSFRMALGAAAQGTGLHDEAEKHFLAARELAARLGPAGDPRRQGVEGALSRVYLAARRHAEAEAVLKGMIAAPPSQSREENWEPWLDLARLYLDTRRFAEAEAPARRGLALVRARFEPEHPAVLRAAHQLGQVLTERRQYREAHDLLREAASAYERRFGPAAPETRQAVADRAEVEAVLRKMEVVPEQ